MLWTEYRPVIKIGPKGALGSHEIRPIHCAPSLGQSILTGAVAAVAANKIGEVIIVFLCRSTTYKCKFTYPVIIGGRAKLWITLNL